MWQRVVVLQIFEAPACMPKVDTPKERVPVASGAPLALGLVCCVVETRRMCILLHLLLLCLSIVHRLDILCETHMSG